jgi:hypothetical protein
MGKSSPPPSPDYTSVANASAENAELSAAIALEQLDWSKEQFAYNTDVMERVLGVQLPAMEEQYRSAMADRENWEQQWQPIEEDYVNIVKQINESGTAQEFANLERDIMRRNAEMSDQYHQRYQENVAPLEQDLFREAAEWNDPQKREEYAAAAMVDVDQQFEAERNNALRQLEGYGIDPSQTRHQALDVGVRTAEAAAKAAAARQGRLEADNIGRALRQEAINVGGQIVARGGAADQAASGAGMAATYAEMLPAARMGDLANFGRGMAAMSSGEYAQAVAAGQAGLGGANQTYQAGSQAMGSPNQWMGQATNAYGTAGNIMNQGYGNEINAWNLENQNSPWGGIGSLAGLGLSMYTGGVFGADGGRVPDMGTDPSDRADNVPAMLSENEYVVPADIVKRKGTDFFDKLIENGRKESGFNPPNKSNLDQGGRQQLADGGPVQPNPNADRIAALRARMPAMRQRLAGVKQKYGIPAAGAGGANPADFNRAAYYSTNPNIRGMDSSPYAQGSYQERNRAFAGMEQPGQRGPLTGRLGELYAKYNIQRSPGGADPRALEQQGVAQNAVQNFDAGINYGTGVHPGGYHWSGGGGFDPGIPEGERQPERDSRIDWGALPTASNPDHGMTPEESSAYNLALQQQYEKLGVGMSREEWEAYNQARMSQGTGAGP